MDQGYVIKSEKTVWILQVNYDQTCQQCVFFMIYKENKCLTKVNNFDIMETIK